MALMTLPMFADETKTVVYSGSWEAGDWNGYAQIDKDKFPSLAAGDKFQVEVTALDTKGTYHCVYIQYADAGGYWQNLGTDETCRVDLYSTVPCTAEFTMNQDMVDKIKSGKALIVKGAFYTADKVTFVHYYDASDTSVEEFDLTQAMGSAWDSSYDPTTKTITWTNVKGEKYSWGGCGWWFGDDAQAGNSKDCSAFTKIVYEFAAGAPESGGIEFQYVSGKAGWVEFSAGATNVEYELDATRSAHVKAIYLKLASAGSLTLNRVYFKKATVTANMYVRADMGCATFCAPFDVTIPEGVEAYKATSVEGAWVKMEAVETTIPAYTPVVLNYKGTEDFTQDFTSAIAEGSEAAGVLTGNYSDATPTVPQYSYILQCNDNKTGWYQVTEADKLKVGPNRCYLTIQDSARAFYGMQFDESTAIQNVASEALTKTDGKYLVNGRLVIVKSGRAYNANGVQY